MGISKRVVRNSQQLSDIVTGADFIIAACDMFHIKLSCSGSAFFHSKEQGSQGK